jgi:hypothetical protein
MEYGEHQVTITRSEPDMLRLIDALERAVHSDLTDRDRVVLDQLRSELSAATELVME